MKQTLKLVVVLSVISLLFSSYATKYSTELIPIMRGIYIEYIDQKGNTVLKNNYLKGSLFREGLALVQADNKQKTWGYIDTKGQYVIPPTYVNASVFSEGIAWGTREDSRPIALNQSGEELFTMDIAEVVGNYTNGLAKFAVYNDEGLLRWGFVDKKGEVVVQPIYEQVKSFNEGLAPVKDQEKGWGYIDTNGDFVIEPQYYFAKMFRYGVAVVYHSIDSVAVIDKEGKVLLTDNFVDLHVDGDFYMFEQGNKFGWLDRDGAVVIPAIYQEIHPFSIRDLALVRLDNLFGYINKKGEMIIEPRYTNAYMFLGDIAPVTQDGYTGFIGKKGNYVIPPAKIEVPFDIATQTYLLDTHFRMVFSEYINIGEILNRMRLEKLEGITPQMTYEEIFALLDKSSQYYENSSSQLLINKKTVSVDVSYSFSTIGRLIDSTTLASKPTGLKYDIYLTGNMNKRIDLLEEELLLKLTNFVKTATDSYESDQMRLSIQKEYGLLSLEITYK
ncbi:WG repeat-containing protein [Myroides pelagicus]|uniref:WG repeat-containing protein n=1 Tax=Myroides pelagicus TaxID=270914 RepID=UPI002DB60FAE|nr:WG repeat-containing protein [Myroides pelagicus]MEC4114812.1 WG repeat-containing protein [Myroides pelagicus]